MEDVKATLKSCIISRKGGIPINELNNDYKQLEGDNIPFKKMGFSSLEDFLKSTDGITLRLGIVHATSANSSHIEKLISKQKTVVKNQNIKFKNILNKIHYPKNHGRILTKVVQHEKENMYPKNNERIISKPVRPEKENMYPKKNERIISKPVWPEKENRYPKKNERIISKAVRPEKENMYPKNNERIISRAVRPEKQNMYPKNNERIIPRAVLPEKENIITYPKNNEQIISTAVRPEKENMYPKNNERIISTAIRPEKENIYPKNFDDNRFHNDYNQNVHKHAYNKRPNDSPPPNNMDDIDYYEDYDTYKAFYEQQFETFKLALWLGIALTQDMKNLRLRNERMQIDSVWNNVLKNNWNGSRSNYCNSFCIGNHQVVGDDFMIDLAYRGYKEDSYVEYGPCISGLTLKKAQLSVIEYVKSPNVLISCGSLDVHMNMSLNSLMADMQQLLLCVVLSGKRPVVCNLPPTMYPRYNETIRLFNVWLSTLTFIRIIDLYSLFMCPHRNIVRQEMFHRQPIYLRYCRPIFLWSSTAVANVKYCINHSLSRQFY